MSNYKNIKVKNNSTLIYLSQSNKIKSKYKEEIKQLKDILKLNWGYIIFLSSTKVYKKSNKKLNEVSKIHKKNNYNKLKINSEKILKRTNINNIILRLTNIYGPNFNKNTLLSDILKNIKNKNKIILKNKNEYVDILYIEDLNNLILKLIKKKSPGIFNIASGKSIKIEKLVNIILDLLKFKKKIVSKTKIKFQNSNKIDISKVQKMIGWSPKISIKKGLNEIFKKNMYFYR